MEAMNIETKPLSNTDSYYRAIFEDSALPGIIFRSDGIILNTNLALRQLHDGQVDQLIKGIALEDLFHQRQRKKVINYYQHISSKKIKASEFLFQCDNGELRFVELIIRPIGNSNLRYATLIDITKNKLCEKRRQKMIDQTSIINEIVAALNSNLNKNQLIKIFFNQISKVFKYDQVFMILCDIECRELEIHFLKDKSEIESRKASGLFCQSFTQALMSCQQIELDMAAISHIAELLGLQIEQHYASQALIQLKTDGQLVGAVMLCGRARNALTRSHIDIFRKLSTQIAIAFMKARLLHHYQQSLTDLSFLASINESLSSSLDLEGVLKQLLESSQQFMKAKICTIHLLNAENKLNNMMICGFENKYLDQFKPQIQQVIQNRRPLVVENIDYNSIQFFKNRSDIQNLNLKSLVVLPVVANRETIALLLVFLDKIHYFSDHELELLSMLAGQAALAIKNAELYKQVEKTKNFLESIIHSSHHIIISTDLEGNATFFNSSACKKIGFASDEVLNLPFFERFIKNGRTIFEGLKQELLSREQPQSFECEMSRKTGRPILISWLFSALVNHQDEIIGTLGIGREATTRQQLKKTISLASKQSES